MNNPVTRRIDVDPVRGPLVARVFDLYTSGAYSLKALVAKAYDIANTTWRLSVPRYRPACVIDAVCPAMVTSVDRCAPVFAGMNSST